MVVVDLVIGKQRLTKLSPDFRRGASTARLRNGQPVKLEVLGSTARPWPAATRDRELGARLTCSTYVKNGFQRRAARGTYGTYPF